MINQSSKYLVIILIAFLIASCVQSVENPYVGGTDPDNTTYKPVINILSPLSGGSIHMGYTEIQYQATDYSGGPGLSSYNLFVDGTLIQSFSQNEDGSNPILYFSSDTLESKLGIDPYNWPSEISYAMTVINKDGAFGETELIDSIYVDRKPVAPGNLILTRINDKSFTLFWDDFSSNETKFEVWRKDGVNNSFLHIRDLAANTISTNDIVNSEIIKYEYKVRSVNGFGNSGFSNIINSSGVPGGDAPTNLIGEALGASTIQLTWDDNSDTELGFKLERRNLVSGIFETLAGLPRNTTEYFDTDLLPLTTYEYRVASYNSSSVSAYSNIVTVATYGQDVPAPTNLIATYDPLIKAVDVSWDDNTILENGTIVERKETINGEYIVIGSTLTDENLFIDDNIVDNQLYYYRARFTTTENFNTAYSNVDTAYVYEAPPLAPSNLQIIEFRNSTFGLWWDDNSNDEEGFEVWRKTSSNGTYILHKRLLPNTTAYNDSVTIGIVYYYKVRAFRTPTYSPFSNEVNTEEGNGGEFPAPTNLRALIVNGNNINLDWTNNATNEVQIIVERKLVSEYEFTEVKRLAPGTTNWTDTDGLSNNLTLYYRLKTKYPQGESEYSSELTVYIP